MISDFKFRHHICLFHCEWYSNAFTWSRSTHHVNSWPHHRQAVCVLYGGVKVPPWDTAPHRWYVRSRALHCCPSAGETAQPCSWWADLHLRWCSGEEPQPELERTQTKHKEFTLQLQSSDGYLMLNGIYAHLNGRCSWLCLWRSAGSCRTEKKSVACLSKSFWWQRWWATGIFPHSCC